MQSFVRFFNTNKYETGYDIPTILVEKKIEKNRLIIEPSSLFGTRLDQNEEALITNYDHLQFEHKSWILNTSDGG